MWEPELASWPLQESSRFVEADGLRWHVQQSGAGPVMLLVHGTGSSTHSWRSLIPLLAPRYTVLAVDLPGHGFTDRAAAEGMSMAGMSRGLGSLLRALALEPVYAVGHSAGVAVLCQMALDRRFAPRLLIGINGALLPLGGAAAFLFLPIARLLAASELAPRLFAWRAGNRASVERLVASTGSRLDAAGVDLYARLVRSPRHVAGALAMMANWDLEGFARRLPRLCVPLALIVGENDRTVPPRQADQVRQRVGAVEIVRLPGLGHLAHEEQPALVAREIETLCDRHPGAPPRLNAPEVS